MSELPLPCGWGRSALGDLLMVVSTFGPARSPSDEFTYFDISSINNEAGVVAEPKVVLGVDAPSRARQAVQEGDVLFSTVRPNLRAIAQVPKADNPVASTGFCVLRPCSGVHAKYLYFLARSDWFLQRVLLLQRGVSYPAVRDADVLFQKIPVAPTNEQTRIVEKLEELLSDLDAGVAELKAAQKKLAQYRQALLKAAVEGALSAEWRAARTGEHETGAQLLVRILAERRRRWEDKQLAKFQQQGKTPPQGWQDKYPEPVQPNTTDLPALPEEWVWASVEQIGEITTGFTPSTSNPEFFGGGIPFFKPTDLDAGYFVSKFRESLTVEGASVGRVLPPLSILVTCIGATIGKTGLVRVSCATNQQINAISVVDALVSPEYVYWVMTSGFGQDQIITNASATTLPILNKSKFERLPIPLPPLSEQEEIKRVLEEQYAQVIEQAEAVNVSLKQSAAQRKNLLKAAFSGQLVPQDPNDEPASALLERIRAERRDRSSSRANKRSTARSRKESTC